MILYYESTKQITIYKNYETIVDYDMAKDSCFGSTENCKEKLNNIVKETLLS